MDYLKKIRSIHENAWDEAGVRDPETGEIRLFHPGASFDTRITPNFRYGELTRNQEERRFTEFYQCYVAEELCKFAEVLRKAFGGVPVKIHSGHRPPNVNSRVGGSPTSEHLYNLPGIGAIDLSIPSHSIQDVQDWIEKNWPYSVGRGARLGFVHIGMRHGNPRLRWDY